MTPSYIILLISITLLNVALILYVFRLRKELKDMNASKNKIFAIIAHDLRNAFHLIINMSNMVIENLQANEVTSAKRKSKIIHDTSVTTYTSLQNLLDWALMQLKGIPFKPTDLSLHDLIHTEVKNLSSQADQKNLDIHTIVDKSLVIRGDEEMLKAVIRNLLSNAIKFSHTGGAIGINAISHTGKITIGVSDNGVGMTEEEQQKLFRTESYLSKKGTASEIGTGLGLKLCKEIIKMHGGEIRVTSETGMGSTFTISLPNTFNGNR